MPRPRPRAETVVIPFFRVWPLSHPALEPRACQAMTGWVSTSSPIGRLSGSSLGSWQQTTVSGYPQQGFQPSPRGSGSYASPPPLHLRGSFHPVHHPPLSTAGRLQVRVGGMAEPPDEIGAQAYVLISLNGQPAAPSQMLPRMHSAFLPRQAWQECDFTLEPRDAARSVLRLEVVSWSPVRGEKPLGPLSVAVESVLGDGTMQLSAPLGVGIEVDWLPPAGRGEAQHVLPGSGVRLATTSWPESQREAARASVWREGYMPSPSRPISVCGLPPSTPPRPGFAWRWGGSTWHEVAVSS